MRQPSAARQRTSKFSGKCPGAAERKRLGFRWGSACCLALWSFPVWGQDAAPAPAPVMVRPLYLEWGITIAMIALAIFVVCRKSNRT